MLLQILLFHDAHDLIHQRIPELQTVNIIYGFFLNLSVVKGIAGSGFIGVDEPRSAQFDAAKIAGHDDTHISDIFREDLVEDGFASCA